jgi:hypothetical protein
VEEEEEEEKERREGKERKGREGAREEMQSQLLNIDIESGSALNNTALAL